MTSRLRPATARARLAASLLLMTALGCGGGSHPENPPPKEAREPPVSALATTPLAGQPISVIPLTILIGEDSLMETPPFNDRVKGLAWADSVIGDVLLNRAPEPKWVLPPELRKMAHRAVGVAPDPDHMGQGVMRAEKLMDIPDPLRSDLRTLVALSGGRFAFIPAFVGFSPDSAGHRADVSLVLVDVRIGKVVWRTMTRGVGSTPGRALKAAMELVLPLDVGIR